MFAVYSYTMLNFSNKIKSNCINILHLFPSFVCVFLMDYIQLGKYVNLQNLEHSNAAPERKLMCRCRFSKAYICTALLNQNVVNLLAFEKEMKLATK